MASASESVLDALANALRLSDDEREYLYRLANKGDQGRRRPLDAEGIRNRPASDWEPLARFCVDYVRADTGAAPEPRLAQLIGELSLSDADFRTW